MPCSECTALPDKELKAEIASKEIDLRRKTMAAQFSHIEDQCTGLLADLSSLMATYEREKADEQREVAKSRCLVVDGLKGQELPKNIVEKMGVASCLIFLDMNSCASQPCANFALDAILQTCQRNSVLDCVVVVGLPTSRTDVPEIASKILGWASANGWPATQLVCQADFKEVQCQIFLVLGASGGAG